MTVTATTETIQDRERDFFDAGRRDDLAFWPTFIAQAFNERTPVSEIAAYCRERGLNTSAYIGRLLETF